MTEQNCGYTEIDRLRSENNLLKEDVAPHQTTIKELQAALELANEKFFERDRQAQELQASLRNHHEQFDDLKSNTEVTLKAIAMMLESLKGDRKPDETREVDGVMVTNYDGNLTHHQKNIIIGNIQRAIANEFRKLKGCKLTDFSYDDQPF